MLGIGRDLCGSASPTPLPKQGHLEQVSQHRIHAIQKVDISDVVFASISIKKNK